MMITKQTLKKGFKFLFALNILDLFLTIIGLSLGYNEINPLFKILGITTFFILKILFVSFVIILYYISLNKINDKIIPELKEHIFKRLYFFITGVCLIFYMIILNNFYKIIITI